MFWYRSCSLFRCLSGGGDICSNKMICMYSKAHWKQALDLRDSLRARSPRGDAVAKLFIASPQPSLRTFFFSLIFFNTHNITPLVLHSLSSTQSEVFPSMAQVPCIVNERMYKLKTQKLRAKECNLGRYQVTFREPFVKIPTIINFPILQHIPCLPHQLFQYLLKYITASVERVCSPWANYSSEP